jgi:ketosteroid isomerase-like protein
MSSVNVENENRLVELVVQGLCEADKSKDLDRVMEFFSEDIIYQPPGVSPLFGKEAVRRYLDRAFDQFARAHASRWQYLGRNMRKLQIHKGS